MVLMRVCNLAEKVVQLMETKLDLKLVRSMILRKVEKMECQTVGRVDARMVELMDRKKAETLV